MVTIDPAGKPSRVFVGDTLRQGPLASGPCCQQISGKYVLLGWLRSSETRPAFAGRSWKDILHGLRSDSLGSVPQPTWSSEQ